MKKKVNQYAQQIEVGVQDRQHVLKDFSRMLDNQVSYVLISLHEVMMEYKGERKNSHVSGLWLCMLNFCYSQFGC